MKRQPPVDDRVVVAWRNLEGAPCHMYFDFHRLPLGSGARAARCGEFDRFKEALKGQGCEVHTWDIHTWTTMNYRQVFYEGKV